jgi:hypothetical protein
MRARIWVAAAVGLVGLAVPASVGAATQIGQTFLPNDNCGGPVTALQSTSPGSSYAAPSDGVLTSWSFQADSTPPSQMKLKVGRHVGGNDFLIVGESQLESTGASQLNTFPTRVSVHAGDAIGFFLSGEGNCSRGPLAGFAFHQIVGSDPPPDATVTFSPAIGTQLDVAASLEPDCDQDGFGDETQDPNPFGGSCPPKGRTLTLEISKPKVNKGKKVRFYGRLDSPDNEQACESNQTIELQRKKAYQDDFVGFEQVQTDAAGSYSTKEKVKKTYDYRAQVGEGGGCDDQVSDTEKVKVKKRK